MTRLLSSAWQPSSGAMNMVLAVPGSGSVPSRWFSGLSSSQLWVSFNSWWPKWTSSSLSQAGFMPSSGSAAPRRAFCSVFGKDECLPPMSVSAGQLSLDSVSRLRPPLLSVTTMSLPSPSIGETNVGYGIFSYNDHPLYPSFLTSVLWDGFEGVLLTLHPCRTISCPCMVVAPWWGLWPPQ